MTQSAPLSPAAAPAAAASAGVGSIVWTVFKLALLCGLGYGGWWGYVSFLRPPSEPCKAYRTFADHFAKGDYREARQLAVGAALDKVEEELAPPPPPGTGMKGMLKSMLTPQAMAGRGRGMAIEMGGSIDKITYRVESEAADGDGVRITAMQRVRRLGTAAHSLFNPPTSCFRQGALVRQEGGAWKVAEFNTSHPGPCR